MIKLDRLTTDLDILMIKLDRLMTKLDSLTTGQTDH